MLSLLVRRLNPPKTPSDAKAFEQKITKRTKVLPANHTNDTNGFRSEKRIYSLFAFIRVISGQHFFIRQRPDCLHRSINFSVFWGFGRRNLLGCSARKCL